jgi:hypothetical protein
VTTNIYYTEIDHRERLPASAKRILPKPPDQSLAFCVLTNQGGPNGLGEKVCHDVAKQLRSRLIP